MKVFDSRCRLEASVSFTLVEMMAVIAIVAGLLALIIPWVGNYVHSAKYHADHQTLTVLNDAITRYKCEGGEVGALTQGMDYTNLLARLRTPVSWSGFDHQFLTGQGQYDKARTVASTGSGRSFRLTQYDTYTQESGGSYSLGGEAGGGYSGPTFVAASYHTSDKAAYSSDGVTWEASTMPSAASWSAMAYGNGKFVALAGFSDKAAYSTDGINWTAVTIPASEWWTSVVYGDGKFVAIADHSANFAYSTDGITWTAVDPGIYQESWLHVAYGNGKFVTVEEGNDAVAYSTDGISWSLADLPSAAYWGGVAYGNGKFVTVGYNSNKAAYSTDGITWVARTLPSTAYWVNVTYGGGKFVAVAGGNKSSDKAAYSTDGITWTAATLPSSTCWRGITYGGGKFVATTGSGSAAAYSSDGITWEAATLPAAAYWSSVAAAQ